MSAPEPLDEQEFPAAEVRGGDRPEDYIDLHTGGADCLGCDTIADLPDVCSCGSSECELK